jgi:hypothetical protein
MVKNVVSYDIENTLSRILKYCTTQFSFRPLLGLQRKFSRKSRDMWYWPAARGEAEHHVPYNTEVMYYFAKTSALYGTL